MKEQILLEQMNEQQKTMFLAEMKKHRKSVWVALVLGITFGGLGAHHYYLRNKGRALLYTMFFWTLIPAMISWIECVALPRKVREFNDTMALQIAAIVKNAFARW